jgi:hypothetical protein
MQCSDVCELLSPYLDGFLKPGEQKQIEAHLKNCVGCQAQLEELRGTINLLQGLPEVTPPAAFRNELRERLQQIEQERPTDRAKAPKRAFYKWPGFMAAAAVLVVALGITGVWGSPARWFDSGEGLIAQLFSGNSSSGTVAVDNGKADRPEKQAGGTEKIVFAGKGEVKEDAPESTDFNMLMEPDGLSREDELLRDAAPPGAGVMSVPNAAPEIAADEEPRQMYMENMKGRMGGGAVAREAHLVLAVTDPEQAMNSIVEKANSYGAEVIASHGALVAGQREVDTVVLELQIPLAKFGPLWEVLNDSGRVMDSNINDILHSAADTGEEQGSPVAMVVIELKK